MDVVIYTRKYCPFCVHALSLLDSLEVTYSEVPVDADPAALAVMKEQSGQHTVPQIWIGPTHVGGCDELMSLHRAGRLHAVLAGDA